MEGLQEKVVVDNKVIAAEPAQKDSILGTPCCRDNKEIDSGITPRSGNDGVTEIEEKKEGEDGGLSQKVRRRMTEDKEVGLIVPY